MVRNAYPAIIKRVDKIFKWNKHGIIAGICPHIAYGFVVPFSHNKRKSNKYFEQLVDAISFRKELLVERVTNIVGTDKDHLDAALEYFKNRWTNEVEIFQEKDDHI